ncbi:MAG: hypothetical protein HOP36_07595 [Methyloglobulus sp.]|nr:hypothetical protein [Methyloglobulus sp.]
MNILKFSVFLLLCFSASAHTGSQVGIRGNIKILLNYEGHNGPLIQLSDMSVTNGFCPRNDYYILPKNHQYFRENYAVLLSAKLTGTPVSFVFTPGDCTDGLPRIAHLALEN